MMDRDEFRRRLVEARDDASEYRATLREWFVANGEPVPEWTEAGWLGGARERGSIQVTSRLTDYPGAVEDDELPTTVRKVTGTGEWEIPARPPSGEWSTDAGMYSAESVLTHWPELQAGSGELASRELN